MPILSTIERRTPAGRLMMTGVYGLLIVGGATMIYPFLLMVATAFTSETDYHDFRVVPEYVYHEEARFAKFLAERYQRQGDFKSIYGRDAGDFVDAAAESYVNVSSGNTSTAVADWHDFKATLQPHEFGLWHIGRRALPGKAELLWRDYLDERLEGDLDALDALTGRAHRAFTEVFAPFEEPASQLWRGVAGQEGEAWSDFKRTTHAGLRRPIDATLLWRDWLFRKYERIEDFNQATSAEFADFGDVPLPDRSPDGSRSAGDWETFVRTALPFRAIEIADGSAAYLALLKSSYGAKLGSINQALGTSYANDADIVWPPTRPTAAEVDAVGAFLRGGTDIGDVRLASPDRNFVAFLRDRYSGEVAALNAAWTTSWESFDEVRPPYRAEDRAVFAAEQGEWVWWFTTRNFVEVFDFFAVWGRSLQNTLILIIAMIAAALTINPLAAYALSRFNLRSTNQVLLFLLATMAFPYEVTMIPSFLLLREFPLWSGLAGIVTGGAAMAAMWRATGGRRPWWSVMVGCVVGVFGALLAVRVLGWTTGSTQADSISLLNTFAALILPGAASGYSIFLLKGFFDSLPEELFEAARIDGAGEMRMLWQIAVPLSMPILAVIMLFTFTATYGSYLWALIVCQDERMWTLAVHLFQLQQWAPTYITMAANVLASLPTLFIFVLAQNMIMRGVIIPSFK